MPDVKTDIKTELKSIKRIDDLINSKIRQSDIIRNQLSSVMSPKLKYIQVMESKVNLQEDKLIRLIDLENEIEEEIDKLVYMKEEVAKYISKVDDLEIRLLLNLRYLEGLNWDRVADKMGYTRKHIHRLHAKALEILKDVT